MISRRGAVTKPGYGRRKNLEALGKPRACAQRFSTRASRPLLCCVRRCPTLPRPGGCSTIGAGWLSFRVRNGSGRFPAAITTETFRDNTRACVSGCGVSEYAEWMRACVVLWVSPRPISTSQLDKHLTVRPFLAYQPHSLWGALPHQWWVGDLIWEQASRLDAFSGYPFRT